MSRREKLRQSMLDDIKAVARQQMAENGTASVSLNAIARALEVSQPALYRYYASRDDLVTALIVDTYNDLAEVMEAADRSQPPAEYGKRLLAVMLAIREWAVEHPVDFELIYGSPIPAYHAPDEITQPTAWRGFSVVLLILSEAMQAGKLKPRLEHRNLPENIKSDIPMVIQGQTVQVDPVVTHLGILGFCLTHGMIMLELHHQTTHMLLDPGAFYRFESENLLRGMGLDV